MFIEELQQGQKITMKAKIGSEVVEFEITVQDTLPKKHTILTDVVMKNDKVISFQAKNLIVDLLVSLSDSAPLVFKNVKVVLSKDKDGRFLYAISTIAEAKVLNRRENYRVFIGKEIIVRGGSNHTAYEAVLKDISSTGFAITINNNVAEFNDKQILHTVLNDRIEEVGQNYSFHLYGIIVRKEEVENDLVVYGCKLKTYVPGLNNYLMVKERMRLARMSGQSKN